MSDVNLGNVRFSATFNTSGLDAGRKAMDSTKAQADSLSNSLNKLKSVKGPDTSWAAGAANLMKNLAAQSTLALGPLSGVGARFHALSAIMSSTGVSGAIALGTISGIAVGMGLLANGAVHSAMMVQRADLALRAITGSAIEAKVQLEFVREVSNKSGTSFSEVAQSWTRFEAAGHAAGMSLSVLKKSFTETAMAAGTLSLSGDDVQGVFKALEQMLSKGVVQSEELRGQLGDRFPAAFAIAAQAVGKTTAELQKMMKKGQVISTEFVPAFTAAAAKIYHIDLSKPIDTLQASLNRNKNAWTLFNLAVDKAFSVSGAFKKIVEGVTGSLEYMAKHLEDIKRIMGGVIGAFAGFAASAAIVAGISAAWAVLGSVTITITGIVGGLRLAVLALNTAMLATPLGWIGFFLKLAGAIGGYFLGAKLAEEMTRKLNKSMVDTSGIDAFIGAQLKLRTATAEATQEMIKQQLVALNIAQKDQADSQKALHEATAGMSPTAISQSAGMQSNMGASDGVRLPGTFNAAKTNETAAAISRVRSAAADLTAKTKVLNAETSRMTALQAIAKKPLVDLAKHMQDLGKNSKHHVDESETAMKKLVESLRKGGYNLDILRQKYALLRRGIGPDTLQFMNVDNLDKAQEALEKIKPKDIPKVNEALAKLGFTAGETVDKLAAFYAQMDQGNKDLKTGTVAYEAQTKAVNDLAEAWLSARQAKIELDGKVGALQSGGSAGVAQYLRQLAIQKELVKYRNDLIDRSGDPGSGLTTKKMDAAIAARRKLLEGNDQLNMTFDLQATAVKNAEDAMVSWGSASLNSLTDVILAGKDLGSTIMDIGKALAKMAIQIVILEPLERAFRAMVSGTDKKGNPKPGGGGGWASTLVAIGAKVLGFADGGSPPVGRASIVGENGPELFVPSVSGRIIPNHQLGSGGGVGGSNVVNINTNVDARGATQETIETLRQELAQRDARLRAELPYLIDGRQRDSRLRGRG